MEKPDGAQQGDANGPITRRSALVAAGAFTGALAIGLDLFQSESAQAAVSYIYPTRSRQVSDTFAIHQARGSVNPGTDYVCDMKTPVVAVAAGKVVAADSSTGGSGGRVIGIDHDDGSKTDYLHLWSIGVPVGARVSQGQQIALSGASGNGSESYYGPHLHISLHIGPNATHFTTGGSVDFEKYVDKSTAPPITPSAIKENDVRVIRSDNGSIALLGEFTVREYTGADAFAYGTATQIWNGSNVGWVQVTVDQYITEVRETRNRRAALLADIKALG